MLCMGKKTDWTAVKDKYVTTECSMRALAKDYGLNVSTVSKKAKKENWLEERQQFQDKLQTKILEEMVRERVSRAKEMLAVSDALLAQIKRVATRQEDLLPVEIKALSSSLKDLRDIQMLDKLAISAPQDNKVTVELVPFEEWVG